MHALTESKWFKPKLWFLKLNNGSSLKWQYFFFFFLCRTGDCEGQAGFQSKPSSSSSSSSFTPSLQNGAGGYHQYPHHQHGLGSVPGTGSVPSSGESNDRSGANSNCVFLPFLNDNRNVSSSLMSHPHLRNVKYFCDGTTHNRHAPTKHNFLCDQKPVSEVIYSHPDFHNISSLSR